MRRILEYFQIDQYFDVIVGANMDGTRTKKSEVIEEALERLQAEESREEVLMVGDRFHDHGQHGAGDRTARDLCRDQYYTAVH